jgi:hypothetical protein
LAMTLRTLFNLGKWDTASVEISGV